MVFEKIQAIVAKELNVDPEKITMETDLVEDLGADSLDAVELVMAVEEEFDCELDDETAQNIRKIGDIVKYIEAHL